MTWRAPTNDDLTSTLSKREVGLFCGMDDAVGGADTVAGILAETVALVRAYCRSNGNVRLSPDAATIPASLMGPAMDYAAYNLLKRLPVPIEEARTHAYDSALRILRDIASGTLTPEGHGDAPESTSGKVAVQQAALSRRRVTSANMEGL